MRLVLFVPIAPEPLLTSLLVIMLGPSCFGDVVLKDLKPFKDYQELAQLLIDRGMDVPDEARAVRKLSQVGYYRLSGFWYACRTQAAGSNKPLESFLPGTCFDRIFELYLFDKRLRLLFLDAIERIEVSLKTRLAHELGRLDSQAHHNPDFINPKQLKSYVHKEVLCVMPGTSGHGDSRMSWTVAGKTLSSGIKRQLALSRCGLLLRLGH